MGLNVCVYRPAGGPDCTRGGISSRADQLCVINVPGPFRPTETSPAAWLYDTARGRGRPNWVLVPAVTNDDGKWRPVDTRQQWYMAGGNLASTSDSRWCEALRDLGISYPSVVAIHDRHEPWPG